MKAAGTKERIIERNRYRPIDPAKAERPSKLIAGMERTLKRRGDIVIVTPAAKAYKVPRKSYL